jgi:hypothetical protein
MKLTARQAHILGIMRDQEEELVYERGEAWIGLERTSRRLAFNLLGLCAVSLDSFDEAGSGKMEHYSISESGLKLLADFEAGRESEHPLVAALRNRDSFT